MRPLTPGFTVSDYLILRLAELGLRDLFAVPGDYVARWFDYVDDRDRGPARLRRYGCRNELEAGYAADAYARVRGIGCVAVTYGVGAFSLLNAVAGSYVERLPVIAISGSPGSGPADRPAARKGGILLHHATGDYRSDLEAYQHVTAHAVIVSTAEQAPAQIDRALAAAVAQKRPVYIEVWRNLWDAECTPPAGPLKVEPLPCDMDAVKAAAREVAARLGQAQRPMLWAGIELQRFGLQQSFADLRDRLGLPYVTSLLAKSVLSEEHPGFVGTYTGTSSDYTTYTAVQRSDLLFVVGDLITDDYEDIVGSDYAQMVVAYDNAVRIGYATYANVPLAPFLEALALTGVERRSAGGTPWVQRGQPAAASVETGPKEGVTYSAFFERMATWVDAGMTLLPDESSSMYVACNLPVKRQNGFVAQAAWGSIGYAAPAGFGLAVADTSHRPVVFAGDGGFQMTAQTLGSMAHFRQNGVVFVMDNGIYGIEQALTNPGTYTQHEPFEAFNVLPRWDYVRLAEALGVQGRKVATLAELDTVLAEVKAQPKTPFLVQVVIPERNIPDEILRLANNTPPPPPKA
jgi:indolepyruvate decarboxylase